MRIASQIIALVLWFVVLTIGIRVDSSSLPVTFYGYSMFVLSSTLTNVGILAILTSILTDSDDIMKSMRRAFVIYLMLISGVVVLFTTSISEATPQQYGKIAGMVSLVCLIVSYQPDIYDSFIERIKIAILGTNDNG